MTKAKLRKPTNAQFGKLRGMKNSEASMLVQVSQWERGKAPISVRICANALALKKRKNTFVRIVTNQNRIEQKMKIVRLVKFEKWAGNPCEEYAVLWNTKLENMLAAFISPNGVGDDGQIACPAEWKEIDLSDLPDSLDFDAVVDVLESATETIMLEGEHAVDFADDEEWVCDHFNCPLDGKKIGNRCDAEEVTLHFKEHGEKPIVLLSFNFFQKRVQYIYAVVPKEWDCREADMRLSGYENDDWAGSLAWLSEYGYLA